MPETLRHREPSGAWWALAACALTIVLAAGTRVSFAAFLVPIETDLNLDRATTANVGALTALSYGLVLPLAGRLATRRGPRVVMMSGVLLMALGGFGVATADHAWQLFLYAGLLPGIGFAAATHVPGTVLLARWFDQRLGLATGIMTSALPAGQAIFAFVAAVLIPVLGWRATYIVFGVLMAAIALPALWFAARDPARPTARSRPTARFPVRAGGDVWLLGLGYFACGFTDQLITIHLIALAVATGLDPRLAAFFLSALLIVGVVGSVLSGPMADAWRPPLMLSTLYLTRAASLPMLLVAGPDERLWLFVIFALLFGATYISNQAPGARYVRDTYGVGAVGRLMGNVGLAHQVGGAAGIALGGLSVSYAGGYEAAVLIAAAVALVGGLLQLAIRPSRA